MQNLITNERGLSLVEVLASTVLLSIIIFAFLTIFPQMKISNESTGENLEAANIAKELLALMKEQSYVYIKDNEQIGEFKYTEKDSEPLVIEGQYKTIENKKINVRITIQTSPVAMTSEINLREMYIEILNDNENEIARIHGYLQK